MERLKIILEDLGIAFGKTSRELSSIFNQIEYSKVRNIEELKKAFSDLTSIDLKRVDKQVESLVKYYEKLVNSGNALDDLPELDSKGLEDFVKSLSVISKKNIPELLSSLGREVLSNTLITQGQRSQSFKKVSESSGFSYSKTLEVPFHMLYESMDMLRESINRKLNVQGPFFETEDLGGGRRRTKRVSEKDVFEFSKEFGPEEALKRFNVGSLSDYPLKDSDVKIIQEALNFYDKIYSSTISIADKSQLLNDKLIKQKEITGDLIDFYKSHLKDMEGKAHITGQISSIEYKELVRKVGVLDQIRGVYLSTNEVIQKQYDQIVDIVRFIPGIGRSLEKQMDKAKDKALELTEDMYNAFSVTFAKTGDGGDALIAAFSKLGPTVSTFSVLLAASAASMYLVYRASQNLLKELRSISQEIGISITQGYNLEKAALLTQTRFDNQLSSLKDIKEVQQSIVREAGVFLQLESGVLNQVSDIAKAFGLTGDKAGQLQYQLMRSGASEKMAANLQNVYFSIAESVDIAPGIITDDLLNNAEFVSQYFSGMPGDAMQLAIEMRRVGMNLEQASRIAKHLLDYEKSITAEVEASIAIGRHVNVGQARELLLRGKTLEAMEHIAREAGTLADFQDLGFAKAKLLGNAMGLQVKEVEQLLFIKEKLGTADEEIFNLATKNYDQIMKLAGGDEKLFALHTNRLLASERFRVSLQKIGNELKRALLPAMEAMLPIFSALADIVSVISKVIKGFIAPFQAVFGLVPDLIGAVGGIGQGHGFDMPTSKAGFRSIAEGPKEEGGWGGFLSKLAGVGLAGWAGAKGIQKLMGKGGKGGGGIGNLFGKLPFGGGPKGTPRDPIHVVMARGIGNFMDIMSGKAGKLGSGAGKVASKAGSKLARAGKSVLSYGSSALGGLLGLGSKGLKSVGGMGTKGMGMLGKVRNRGLSAVGSMGTKGMEVIGKVGNMGTKGIGMLGKVGSRGLSAVGSMGTKGIGMLGKVGNAGKGLLSTLGPVAKGGAGKGLLKGLGKFGGKSLAKKIPGISIIAGAALGINELLKGDLLGAGGELASGVLGSLPGLGTAGSLAIDTALAARDFKNSGLDHEKIFNNEGSISVIKSGENEIGSKQIQDLKDREMLHVGDMVSKRDSVTVVKLDSTSLENEIRELRKDINSMGNKPVILEENSVKQIGRKIRSQNGY